MKKFIVLFTLLTLQSTFTQVTQEWAARYNSTYNLNDIPVSIVADKLGNSYVTGYSYVTGTQNTVAATIKYNPQGVSQWVRIYYDASQPENHTIGISIDTSSNIYITGYSGNVNTQLFYTWIIKYNTNGDSLWSRRYYGSGQGSSPTAIITDKSGNSYLVGYEAQGSYTIKYNPIGDTLWTRVHQESGYQFTTLDAIALDSSGNVYLGGGAHVVSYVRDFLVVKYNNDGVKQWSRTYGIYNKDEIAHKIAVDRFSNVYITGTGYDPVTTNYYNFLTIKYNSSGVQQWARIYHRGVDEAYNLVIDYSDNVIVTGSSSSTTTGLNYCTIKYTPSGDTQWVRIYMDTSSNPYDIAYSITVDSSNNIYVNGRGGSSGPATTIKYSSNGIQLWKMNYPMGSSSLGNSIAIDNTRNIFITGSDGDYVTIKYSQFSGISITSNEIPIDHKLYQNYPNPFNSNTIIQFAVPYRSNVTIGVFDIIGRKVAEILSEEFIAGKYSVNWNAGSVSSGIYFCKLSSISEATGNNVKQIFQKTIKMILIK